MPHYSNYGYILSQKNNKVVVEIIGYNKNEEDGETLRKLKLDTSVDHKQIVKLLVKTIENVKEVKLSDEVKTDFYKNIKIEVENSFLMVSSKRKSDETTNAIISKVNEVIVPKIRRKSSKSSKRSF